MDYLGLASIEFTHAPESVKLTAQDGSQVELSEVCREVTPPCHLNPFLFNGHLQTMWTAVATAAPDVYYRRQIFQSDSKSLGGSFAVDFAVAPHTDADPSLPPRTAYFAEEDFAAIGSDDHRPMLLVLHGLSGGSHEVYLRHCVGPLVSSGGDGDQSRNWVVCVVNSRGCANSAITSGVFFNGRATWDIRQMAKWARKTFPNRPLFGLGFSLGANIITNYVGEDGENCLLSAAVAVGNPFDLQISNKALQRNFVGSHVYEGVMGESLKKLIRYHKESVLKLTDFDYDRIMKVRTIYEFDREVQCPTWGYPTEEAYYRDASSCDALSAVRIPFFVVQAKDDPIAVSEGVPVNEFKGNPYTVLCTTSLGGHLSWFELGGGRWFSKPVTNFLQKMATDINLKVAPEKQPSVTETAKKHAHSGVFHPVRRRLAVIRTDSE